MFARRQGTARNIVSPKMVPDIFVIVTLRFVQVFVLIVILDSISYLRQLIGGGMS